MEKQLQGCVIALLVGSGARPDRVVRLRDRLRQTGARLHLVALHRLPVATSDGTVLPIDANVGSVSPLYYDGLVIPDAQFGADALDVDEDAIALLQVFAEEHRPIAAIGKGVELLADAGLVQGRRIASRGDVAILVEEADGEPSSDEVVADRLIVTGRTDCDLGALVEAFADDVEAVRMRDNVDESGRESFPASDAHSGSSAMHS